ncbi:hypothetical protein FACS1894133_1710 [Clostridia bacterium]|nr:hypothetical protein FACS1894133_1710 [Clostridia bacterium]
MKTPILDKRDKNQIIAQLSQRIKEYTPEWNYVRGDSDPGAAIVELFSEMFYQTIERFNQLPHKYYTEFLNILGVKPAGATSAEGFVQFTVGGIPDAPVAVPARTEVFAKSAENNIVYATKHRIDVTGAQIEDIYYVDTTEGRIELLPPDYKENTNTEQLFFESQGGENLQLHRFAFGQNDVLNIQSACTITAEFKQSASFFEEQTVQRFSDPDFAKWKYMRGGVLTEFDTVLSRGNMLILRKNTDSPIEAEKVEDGKNGKDTYIYCDMYSESGSEISLSKINLSSQLKAKIRADMLFNDDVPIVQNEGNGGESGGYCFGRMPAEYGLFYIKSDTVFSKRRATAHLEFDMSFVVYSDVNTEPQYEFTKRVIDKRNVVKIIPDDVFVESVIWEYYNGVGWSLLRVTGNNDLFSGRQTENLAIEFTVPDNISKTLVNADEGYFVRARIRNVENFLSIHPRRILPFIKTVMCDYRYSEGLPAEFIYAENNGERVDVNNFANITDAEMHVYRPMPPQPRTMYIAFDVSPHSMPLSLMFEIAGTGTVGSKIYYEVMRDGKFEQVQLVDNTENLRYTGIVFLYIDRPLTKARLFGRDAFWIRMCATAPRATDNVPSDTHRTITPRVLGIQMNITEAVQKQSAPKQFFSTDVYDAGKVIRLMEKPVLSHKVYVDGAEWKRTGNISLCGGSDCVYELDPATGEIKFGNGIHGKVPPGGISNISVEYEYGGGERGNVGTGRVIGLVGSIPRISSVSNITPMCGGTDAMSDAKVKSLGNKIIRYRQIAVSPKDFEEIIAARFQRVAHVRCFACTNENGKYAPGHICIAVMGANLESERMSVMLCREIYEYIKDKCDCCLISGGRLHIVPSTEITVNVSVSVALKELDLAAETQQLVSDRISTLINNVWRSRDIGDQIDLTEIYKVIKSTPNVLNMANVLHEGSYARHGRQYLVALEQDFASPLVTVKNGVHSVRLI